MEKSVLSVKDLTVSFDGYKVVDNLSFDIGENELRVIIGPNGAGKTTVLDLISGKTKPTAGSVKFLGQEIMGVSENQIVKLGLGRKFQTPSIFEDLTVFENLEISFPRGRDVIGALFFKRDKEVLDRADEVASIVYLSEVLNKDAASLSHGQKQWLEIGILLAQKPNLLLIDEPAAGMTAPERKKTVSLLKNLSNNQSVIVVEHDMEFIKSLDCRVTVLHEGSVITEGSLDYVSKNEKVIDVYLGR